MKKEDVIKYWENRQPFKDEYDIGNLPIVNKELWNDFFIPKIIELGGIPKKDLIDGATYLGKTRNSTIAMWDKKENKFVYYRYKFGSRYRDVVNHFEDDNGFALFVPIKLKRK